MTKKSLDTISTIMTTIGLVVGLVGKLADGRKASIEINEAATAAAKKAVAEQMSRIQNEREAH